MVLAMTNGQPDALCDQKPKGGVATCFTSNTLSPSTTSLKPQIAPEGTPYKLRILSDRPESVYLANVDSIHEVLLSPLPPPGGSLSCTPTPYHSPTFNPSLCVCVAHPGGRELRSVHDHTAAVPGTRYNLRKPNNNTTPRPCHLHMHNSPNPVMAGIA